MVIETLASIHRITFAERRGTYFLGSGKIDHKDLLLAMPQTFMNQSGVAVKQLLDKTGVDPSEMLVVHDELDLALGRIQIKFKAGHGGNKGVLSIISTLQTKEFYRLRVGVGRPTEGLDPAEYLLQPFEGKPERVLLEAVIHRSTEALRCAVVEGPEKAMERYNQREIRDQ
jgi:PTH1 family peptidyl-tRNA hydrolase